VVGYSIVRQRREIGIRIAIGASSAGVLRTVVRSMTGPVLLGMVAGIAASVVLSRSVAGFMYEVNPADPLALLAVAGVLMIVAFIAVIIPARRATQIDPAKVLTTE
jgi:ABC-type antimicrobial peptide transport system permease subunit